MDTTHIIDIDLDALTMTGVGNLLNDLTANLRLAINGQPELITALTCAVLTGRPVALTGVPGIAKSHGAKALAYSVGNGDWARVQCMPDLMPADFTGYNWPNQLTREFELRTGPLFRRVIMLDELNRASGRSLAGIMEAVEEGTVSIDGVTYALPRGRIIIATWNPLEHAGTEKLPDAIRDRFELCAYLGYPEADDECDIIVGNHKDPDELRGVISEQQALELQSFFADCVRKASPAVLRYIRDLLDKTRQTDKLDLGASPRAGKSLLRVATCFALFTGRNSASVHDVQCAAKMVLRHRLEPSYEAFDPTRQTENEFIEEVIEGLL